MAGIDYQLSTATQRCTDHQGNYDNRVITVQAAAIRTRRTRRTIEAWISTGLLDVTVIKNQRGTIIRRYLDEDELLSVLRDKLATRQRAH